MDLFLKPWHAVFNLIEELPSRVPVWVCLLHLALKFWREDILQRIADLLGKPTTIDQQTLDRKVISFTCICVEIDLNNPLPDPMEICLGSSSWVQQLDYESLPFRCRIFHEYGHLQRQCPMVNKNSTPSTSAPASVSNLDKGDIGKSLVENGDLAKDGFVLVKA